MVAVAAAAVVSVVAAVTVAEAVAAGGSISINRVGSSISIVIRISCSNSSSSHRVSSISRSGGTTSGSSGSDDIRRSSDNHHVRNSGARSTSNRSISYTCSRCGRAIAASVYVTTTAMVVVAVVPVTEANVIDRMFHFRSH